MSQPKIFLIGAIDRPEFLEARRTIEALGDMRVLPDLEAGIAALEELADADLIVITQTYPGEFAASQIDRMRRLAPLARIVAVLGTWCEGEMRSGKPWPGVIRVYWHQATACLRRELASMARAEASSWSLPFTATDDERLLAVLDEPPRHRGLIAISTRCAEMQAWLSEACIAAGCSTVWMDPSRPTQIHGASAGIFDSLRVDPGDRGALRRFVKDISPAPVIVLVDSPRIDDIRDARAAGAVEVISKPLVIEDLYECLGGFVSTPDAVDGGRETWILSSSRNAGEGRPRVDEITP